MSSSLDILKHVIRFIKSKPDTASIMDLGCGSGTVAKLIKDECPDIVFDGVDAFPKNINYAAMSKYHIYRNLFTGLIEDQVFEAREYSIVLSLEVFDKMKKDIAYRMINRYAGNLLASFPIIEQPQGALFGNPYEERLSYWNHFEIMGFARKCVHRGYRFGLYWI